MSFIEIEIDLSALNALLENPSGLVDKFVELVTIRVEQRGKVNSPRRSSEMAKAHRTRRGSGRSWEVLVGVDYAMTVHNGRKARIVVPRRAKKLRWRQDGTGEVVFSAKAKQPAIPGNPWLRRSLVEEFQFLDLV